MKYTEKYKELAEPFGKNGCDEYMIRKFIRQEMEAGEFRKGEGTTDMEALRLWKRYPDEAKEIWLHNAFCFNCGNTSFKQGYNLWKDKFVVVIEGFCNKWKEQIVRCCD